MRRQKNLLQTKEQDKSPEKDINEMKISSLSDKQFKVMFIKMVTKLERRMDGHSRTSTKRWKV